MGLIRTPAHRREDPRHGRPHQEARRSPPTASRRPRARRSKRPAARRRRSANRSPRSASGPGRRSARPRPRKPRPPSRRLGPRRSPAEPVDEEPARLKSRPRARASRPLRLGPMFSWLANAWRVPELRRRVLFTAFILLIYRFGSWVPSPGVDSEQIKGCTRDRPAEPSSACSTCSRAASLARLSIFALGIMPYITASIILQLMTVVVPRLEQLQKEGESGLRQDQPVHALSDDRARCGAVDRLRVPVLRARARSSSMRAGSSCS